MSVQFRSVTLSIKALESIWWWSLTVDQVVASSILVTSAGLAVDCQLTTDNYLAAFDYWLGRLLLRQQEGDRNSYAVLR